MATNRDIAHEDGSGEYDDWPGESIPLADQIIFVAALLFSAAALVQTFVRSYDDRSVHVILALPAMMAILALLTHWEYAYALAIGLCLFFGVLGLVSIGVVAYLPLAALLIARFVREERRRGEPEPFSNASLGVMFLASSPLLFWLFWLGELPFGTLAGVV